MLGDSTNIQVDLTLRTEDVAGLLFFMYGGQNVYIYAAILNSTLMFSYRQDSKQTSVVVDDSNMNLCTGNWRSLSFSKVCSVVVLFANKFESCT